MFTKMLFIIYFIFIILILFSECQDSEKTGARIFLGRALDSEIQNKSYSNDHVKVKLEPKFDSGIIKLQVPEGEGFFPVCYPDTANEQIHASRLAHVYCRQMGFTTYGSKYKEKYQEAKRAVPVTSVECTGREDAVASCPWNLLSVRDCQEILALQCSNCQTKIEALNGTLLSPGYPHAYFYSLNCEWRISVPPERGINLTFKKFLLPGEQKDCESYVELTYGFQRRYVIRRVCSGEEVYQIFVPLNSVRIRFHSGVYKEQNEILDYGVNIHFQAEPVGNGMSALSVGLISVIIVLVASCIGCYAWGYIRWRKFPSSARQTAPVTSNVPSTEQIETAVEFHRCIMRQQTIREINYSSDNSDTDLSVAAWRENQSNQPVTIALAPVGPVGYVRNPSMSNTPLGTIPTSCHVQNAENSARLGKLRTRLAARFSSRSSKDSSSNMSVFFTPETKARNSGSSEEVARLLEKKEQPDSQSKGISNLSFNPSNSTDSV